MGCRIRNFVRKKHRGVKILTHTTLKRFAVQDLSFANKKKEKKKKLRLASCSSTFVF